MTRKFDLKGRQVEGVRVEVPAGRAAFDLETGRTVRGPAEVWQEVKGEKKTASILITEEERRALVGEPEAVKGKPGRPKAADKAASSAKPPEL